MAERSKCPVVYLFRETAVARWNEYAREASKQKNHGVQFSKYDASPILEHSSPRFSRRHTLTEYDNRRDSVIPDRYYMGIYPFQG